MELKPRMTHEEAIQLSNVLSQAVFRDRPEISGHDEQLTETQKKIGSLAVARLRRKTDSNEIALDLEPEELKEVVRVAQVALDDPRGIMFGLIAPELDMDETFHWDERGDALRSLAVAADFVELSHRRREV